MTIEELLEREEGFVPHAYLDHLGYWTIGFGTLIDKKRGGKISRAAGMFMLEEKLDEIRAVLDSKIAWWRDLNEDRQTILMSMAYQMGTSGLLSFRNTLEAVRTGDYKKAAQGIRSSLWYRQTPGRAERMAKAMESGVLT